MSPLDEAEARMSVPSNYVFRFLIQAKELIPHIWDLICVMLCSFCWWLCPLRSQILTTLSTDPTAMYLELGEKAQALRDEGFSLGLG